MKQCLVFVIAFQLLLTSVLGYAHLASQPHEPYEAPHIHTDKAMFGSVISDAINSGVLGDEHGTENHDRTECHSHLFSFVLPPLFDKLMARTPELSLSREPQSVGIVHAPPVPPPTT